MSYSDYSGSNEPRNSRVTLGFSLAIGGIAYGLFVAVPQLHRAFVMQPLAQQLTWAELIQGGLGDNAHVELRAVDIPNENGEILSLQKLISEIDPQGDRPAMQKKLVESVQGIDAMQLLQQSTIPVKVIPRGIDPDRVPPVIVISRFDPGLATARQEIASKASITGYVRKASDLAWCDKLLGHLGESAPKLDLDQRPRFVVSSTLSVPDRNWSIGLVAGCSLVAALGLVVCGSGGPSLLGFLFMPIPSLVSMLGFPLRYGRGGRLIRSLYLLLGLAGLVGGGYLAWYPGGITRVDGDMLLQSLGFVAITLGIASLLGARISARSKRTLVSYDNHRSFKEPEQGFSIAKVPALKPKTEAALDDQYNDPRLSDASEKALQPWMDEQVEALIANGFSHPKQVFIHEESQRHLTALMLGCHQIVLCELVEHGKSALTRIVSVLSDGLVVITLSASTPRVSPLRVGSNGVYSRAKSDSPTDMLAEHLDRTVSIAEERHSQVIAIDERERMDVFLLARRVLIDIQNEYHEAKWTILAAKYGRFAFPGRSVEQLVRS